MNNFRIIFTKLLLMFTVILTLLLTSCFNRGGPIYIDSILVYENDELLTGTYQYHDGEKWQEYNLKKKTKEKIYYRVPVKGEEIKVVFNIYAPNTIIKEVKIVTNIDLDFWSNETVFIEDDIEQEESIFACSYEFVYEGEFNAITITGFATSNGLKYMGAKGKESNFVLWGVSFNKNEE